MKTQTRNTLAAGSLLAFALLATGCSSGSGGGADFSDAETVSQAFPYSGQSLTIDTGTADLVLVSGGSDEVKIDRQIAGTANGESPEATGTLNGDTLNLSVDCNGLAIGCKGRFTVTVPDGVAVVAQNKNSLIKASDFSADLTVSAANGQADLAQLSSSTLTLTGRDMDVNGAGLSAKTVTTDTRNGDIDLTFSDAPDRVEVNSNDGNVSLALPDTEYRVEVSTKKGNDDVSVPRSDSSSHIISVTTRNGDVAIIPAS
ncbi:DUF4097 family beta strand repeat-containing protein [Rhodococcus kronopolitis]|uniref:DUF4097 family beta strand repeat-containing protein n=1 Tax=Rhodococcus kronopolitis TaxID=1460226 RepID=A0ABV9FXV2_9NOCA